MLRFTTAGESHGEALVATLSGLPAGIPISQDFVNRELWRRQQGYGRGGRMKIERDTAHILSGVRHGKTIGSPIAMLSWPTTTGRTGPSRCRWKKATRPSTSAWRLRGPVMPTWPGALKYNFTEARYVLERASARESAARVAGGALAKLLLRELGHRSAEPRDRRWAARACNGR